MVLLLKMVSSINLKSYQHFVSEITYHLETQDSFLYILTVTPVSCGKMSANSSRVFILLK